MHLLIDAQALQTPGSRHRGIGRYSQDLIHALAAVRPGWSLELVQAGHMPPIDPEEVGGLPIRTFHAPLPAGPGSPENTDLNERYYADWLTDCGCDALLVCSIFEHHSVVPWFGSPRPRLYASVLYDLIPLVYSRTYLSDPATLQWYARRFRQVCQADRLLSISQASADDFHSLGLGGPEVSNIRGATDGSFTPPDPRRVPELTQALRARFGIDKEFILYVGGFDYRKNLTGAMETYAGLPPEVRDRVDLVIACQLSPAKRDQLFEAGTHLGIAGSLRLTGFVSEEELRALYQTCRVFFFPSLYEGLGLPVLEALRCGAPVVASDCSSVSEYAGRVSWLADPRDSAAMAVVLAQALAEPRAHRLTERLEFVAGFSWRDTAERAAATLEAAPKIQARPRRARVAWVSPIPPTPSGIADYSEELIRPLARRYDIEVVIDARAERPSPSVAVRHPVVTDREVAARHAAEPYDLFVYHLGNSELNNYMVPLMHRFPGLLVLHDFYLGGLVRTAQHRGYWSVPLDQELAAQGETALAQAVRRGEVHGHVLDDLVPLNKRAVALADAVIVHSRWSWGRVRRLTTVPVCYIPHHAPPLEELPSRARERQRLGLSRSAFIVATLGLIGEPKRVDSLLKAVAALPLAVRSACRVVLVGEAAGWLRDELLGLACRLGIGPQVRYLGGVPMRDFLGYARAADVCVQLRHPTRGEVSGALIRALSVGAACITSDQGPMGELPPDVTLKVRTPHREVEDLTENLLRLYEHPEQAEAMRRAARRHIAEHHALETVAAQFAVMIDQTAAARRAADRAWLDMARACIAEHPGELPEELFLDWADLRAAVRRSQGLWPAAGRGERFAA